jgi:hypothetical protein
VAQGDDWPLLSEALGRFGSDALTAARDMIGRGSIPVLALRSDTPRSTTPDRVEKLLTQAKETYVWFGSDAIIAFYSGDQDRRSILGPRSNLQSLDVVHAWSYGGVTRLYININEVWHGLTLGRMGPTDWAIGFRNCRVHSPSLATAPVWLAAKPTVAEIDPSATEGDLGADGTVIDDNGQTDGAPDDLRPASDRQIHVAITTVYNEAERTGTKPPNIKEVREPVQHELRKTRHTASGNHIMRLAGEPQHNRRRRKPGKTLASEKKRNVDCTK